MRALFLMMCVGSAGCAQGEPLLGMPSQNGNGDQADSWADETGETYTARFGGSIDMGDDGEVETGTDEGSGEEYLTISSESGVECDWRWKTDALVSAPDQCVGCDIGWDITCYDGHQNAGNCEGWVDPGSSTDPVQFYLAFEPTGTVNGVEVGTIYVRSTPSDPWSTYAQGTREGTVVNYAYEYDLYY